MVCKGTSDVKEQKRGIVADELALEKRIVVQKDDRGSVAAEREVPERAVLAGRDGEQDPGEHKAAKNKQEHAADPGPAAGNRAQGTPQRQPTHLDLPARTQFPGRTQEARPDREHQHFLTAPQLQAGRAAAAPQGGQGTRAQEQGFGV